jgi:hypothetical protein
MPAPSESKLIADHRSMLAQINGRSYTVAAGVINSLETIRLAFFSMVDLRYYYFYL